MKIGDEVFWSDPDGGLCSGYGLLIEIKGDIYFLQMESGGETQAFKHELS